MLAYLLSWISGLVIILLEKQHMEVRFHAAQSILLGAVLTVFNLVGNMFAVTIWVVGGFISSVIGLVSLALWIFTLIKGYQLEHFKLPVIGDYAEKLARG